MNMKTKYIIPVLYVFAFFVQSCNTFLDEDPKSYIAETNFYKNNDNAIGAINAAYGAMRQEVVNLDFMWMNELTTDDVTYTGTTVGERIEMDLLVYNSKHNFLKNQWFYCYNCINRANVVLDYVNEGVTDSLKYRIYGEARFLRAFQYFRLVRWFGGVPLKIKATNGDPASLYQPRATVQQVYDQIIEDLKYAEQNLDDKYSYTDPLNGGRATAGAAKALLGKVYLTMAGYPLQQTDKWQLAADKLNEVIVNKAKYGYDLMPNLADIFDVEKKAANTEAIWYTSGTNGLTQTGWYFTRMYSWSGNLIPTKEMWKTSTKVFTSGSTTNIDYNKYDSTGLYEITDLRRKAFIKRRSGTNHTDIDTGTGTPVYAKYIDIAKGSTDSRNDYPHIRYTEVVLMAAEALAEVGGQAKMDSALMYINLLRGRAGVGSLTYTDQNILRDIIHKERRRELCYEGHRWCDLVRWNIFPETIKNHLVHQNYPTYTLDNLNYIGNNQNLFPIPAAEIINNPNFGGQNPGYE